MEIKVGKEECAVCERLYVDRKAYERLADEIYDSVPSFDRLYPSINTVNKDFFMYLYRQCPENDDVKYYRLRMLICLVLFMYNEKQALNDCLTKTAGLIEKNPKLSEDEKNRLLGEVYYIRGYTEFNRIHAMSQFYAKSLEYNAAPFNAPASAVPFTFGCPSMLHIFHREGNVLEDELDAFTDMMSNYCRFSEKHGSGAGALFKAEVLYNRGNINDSQILCHKAMYMAGRAEQTCIVLGALLLLAKISIFEGDSDRYIRNIEIFRKIKFRSTNMDAEYNNMIDMCEAVMYLTVNDRERVPAWLTDWRAIDCRINPIGMSYANLIYAKYLLTAGEYKNFRGISGLMLETADAIKSAYAKIYIYIYIAIANAFSGSRDKTVTMLCEAVSLAAKDMIIMPFVENAACLDEFLDEVSVNAEYREFIRNVRTFSGQYTSGLNAILKGMQNKKNFGLTVRESDVAKLAAKRYSNKEIAEKLFIAESTVKSNLKSIFSKLGISSRTELSKYFK